MRPHIAVFNDHRPILRLMEVLLESAGYRATIHFQKLTDAEHVAGLEPDLVILGYFHQLDMAEIGIIEELRAHPRCADKPILVVTTLEEFVEAYFRRNRHQKLWLLRKPFDRNRFLEAVARALPVLSLEATP